MTHANIHLSKQTPEIADTCSSKDCHVVSCRVVSCRVVSCRVVSCRVVSCRVVSCRDDRSISLIMEFFFNPECLVFTHGH